MDWEENDCTRERKGEKMEGEEKHLSLVEGYGCENSKKTLL